MKTTKPISVALVDDDALMRMVFRNIFEAQGLQVLIEADNGADFLAKLRESPVLPDTCLLDVSMPVMDGFETAKKLHAQFPSIKILAYSSNPDPRVKEQMIACGAHDFVEKGFGADVYIAKLTAMAGD